MSSSRARPWRTRAVVLVCSWVLTSFFAIHVYRPLSFLYGNGDSISRFGHALLFSRYGFRVYDTPSKMLCRPADEFAAHSYARAVEAPEGDVCDASATGWRKPYYFVNWQNHPQPYPPGAMLFSAAEAWLFAATDADLKTLNVITKLKFLCVAHLLLWLIARALLDGPWRVLASPATGAGDGAGATGPSAVMVRVDRGLGGVGARWWLMAGVFTLIYCELIRWTLSGVYDAVAIAAVALAAGLLERRRGLDALLALSTALFLHYRALWYLPMMVPAARLGWGELRPWPRRFGPSLKLGLCALMLGLSAHGLVLLLPALGKFPASNPILYSRLALSGEPLWAFGLPAIFVLVYLLRARRWLLAATMAWQCMMLAHTPQTMPWHPLFLIPLIVMAALTEDLAVVAAACGYYVMQAQVVFGVSMLPGHFVSSILEALRTS